MGSLLLKWVFFGVSMAALSKYRRAAEAPQRIKQQAAGVARKGLFVLSGILVASFILSAGVIIAINNWFTDFQLTGSFSMPASVWGGIVLALLGSGILYYVWPREAERLKKIEEEQEKSDLESTIVMLLKAFLDERREKRELKRLNRDDVASLLNKEKRSVS